MENRIFEHTQAPDGVHDGIAVNDTEEVKDTWPLVLVLFLFMFVATAVICALMWMVDA